MENNNTLHKHTEFETKYRIEPSILTEFKRIMDGVPGLKKFLYVEGPDTYYTSNSVVAKFEEFLSKLKGESREEFNSILDSTIRKIPAFIRYRKPSHGLDNDRKEITTKYKESDKNNVNREEKNLRVDNTPDDTIKSFIEDMGYSFNFSIWKGCHIYKYDDATVVFYSVYDTTNGRASKMDSFIEIEVEESTISNLNEKEAWGIIEKYERILSELGISPQKRLKKSLFEMYRR